ncbi:MAG: alpha/beta hydrolase [Planctomycetia bacterium]|nr:alpha/beta hydrolase [Planctomycetia bacterium]
MNPCFTVHRLAAVASAVLFIVGSHSVAAETPQILLWPDGAPGAVGSEDTDKPCVWLHRAPAETAGGGAVVVCPGGGYRGLAMSYEGHEVAQWFNELGVTAVVLRYRLAPRYHHPAPMSDAQRAVRLVRSKAAEWGVDPARIGIMGFSAGGHLASTVATHFDDGNASAADAIDRAGCRPDFAILAYPVIAMSGEYMHRGSRDNLLGENPPQSLIDNLSNEKQVTERTPPTFLFHTAADKGVPAENSLMFFQALRRAGVPGELHIYESGPHGVGLARKNPVLSTWPECLATWLESRGLLAKKP